MDTTIDVSIPDDPPFSKVTEIRITREDAAPFRMDEAGPSVEQNSSFAYIQSSHRPYSVNVQAGIALPTEVQLETICSDNSPDNPPPDDEPYHNSRTTSEVNAAAWAYTKYAMLFFVALLVTWVSHLFRSPFSGLLFKYMADLEQVPSTVNRVYALVYPDVSNFGLNYASSFVLPLQGFWNSLIYMSISWHCFKSAFANFRISPFGHAYSGAELRRPSSGNDSTRRLTV